MLGTICPCLRARWESRRPCGRTILREINVNNCIQSCFWKQIWKSLDAFALVTAEKSLTCRLKKFNSAYSHVIAVFMEYYIVSIHKANKVHCIELVRYQEVRTQNTPQSWHITTVSRKPHSCKPKKLQECQTYHYKQATDKLQCSSICQLSFKCR